MLPPPPKSGRDLKITIVHFPPYSVWKRDGSFVQGPIQLILTYQLSQLENCWSVLAPTGVIRPYLRCLQTASLSYFSWGCHEAIQDLAWQTEIWLPLLWHLPYVLFSFFFFNCVCGLDRTLCSQGCAWTPDPFASTSQILGLHYRLVLPCLAPPTPIYFSLFWRCDFAL